jgi:hypothetical protein
MVVALQAPLRLIKKRRKRMRKKKYRKMRKKTRWQRRAGK